jgi:predicted transcriptional regulator
MEWMLQVADELDDVAGSIALLWIGVRHDAALALLGAAGAAGLVAVTAIGIAPSLICASAALLSAALALSFKARFERASS